jgi:hypothetical protein
LNIQKEKTMSTKNKPGVHVFKTEKAVNNKKTGRFEKYVTYYYWNTIAPNGRLTANGEEHPRKAKALNSIRSTSVTLGGPGKFKYYDHSKPNIPLQSYL